jgi:hypothetical protein
MPYDSAYRIYKDPESTIPDYAHAIKELGVEEGYIIGTVSSGSREAVGCEADLLKILLLSNALVIKLDEKFKENSNHD